MSGKKKTFSPQLMQYTGINFVCLSNLKYTHTETESLAAEKC